VLLFAEAALWFCDGEIPDTEGVAFEDSFLAASPGGALPEGCAFDGL
jgi:hypothetical protein